MSIWKLHKEEKLLTELQVDTVSIIHGCSEITPIKKLVECYDIIQLTFEIHQKFPTAPPSLPECDEGALLHLKTLTRELFVYHRMNLPSPACLLYFDKVLRLLTIYQIPRS